MIYRNKSIKKFLPVFKKITQEASNYYDVSSQNITNQINRLHLILELEEYETPFKTFANAAEEFKAAEELVYIRQNFREGEEYANAGCSL